MEMPDNLTIYRRVRWWPKGRVWIERHVNQIALVKVQIPLATDDDSLPQALVHSEDRSLYGFAPIKEDLRKAMDGRVKGYFFAQGKGRALRLYGRAANQDW